MGETADTIKKHIEETRNRLGQDLNDLEYRVKSVTDWRAQLARHPWAAVGIAFAGGLLLALATTRAASNAARS